jgi:uroporphyrinogen decarboxylase
MNGLQRCLSAFRGEMPDCVPVAPENYQFCIRHSGYRMKDVARDGNLLADCLMRTVEDFDYDGVTIDLDNAASAEVLGCPVAFRDDEAAVVSRPALEALAYAGRLPRVPVGAVPGRWGVYADCAARLRTRIGDEKLIIAYCDQGPFSLAAIVRGMDRFLMEVAEGGRETEIHRLLEITTEVTTAFARLLAGAGAHVVVFGDAIASCDVVSPGVYREFALPYEKRVVAALEAAGVRSGVHVCGNVTPILGDLCATGAAMVEIDYKCDLPTVARVIAGRAVVRGTLDPAAVMRFGTPQLVRARTEEAIDILGSDGRLIVSTGCDMSPDTPPENLRAMVAAAHGRRFA